MKLKSRGCRSNHEAGSSDKAAMVPVCTGPGERWPRPAACSHGMH